MSDNTEYASINDTLSCLAVENQCELRILIF